jgi:GNAT superfamily N-acetyltransferase
MLARDVEEPTLNAWPPLTNVLYDGWVLSFSDGYTRRANSVHSLYPSRLPLADKIAVCEAAYAARGQGSVGVHTRLEDVWFEDFNRLSATPESFRPAMLGKIAPAHAFASIARDGRTVALGLAVAERGYVGLFDVIVDLSVRNQGFGRRLVTRLLQWGPEQGAGRAHLAVVYDNGPALNLYAKCGFKGLPLLVPPQAACQVACLTPRRVDLASAREESGPVPDLKPICGLSERKGWDSNPRRPHSLNNFQDCRNRPLCHPSER